MNLYLNDMGVIGPIGAGKADVLARLLAADGSGMEPYVGLLTGRSTVIGRVRDRLPATRSDLAELDCRNNRLLARALDQIAEPIADLRDTFGADRIAVVLGTSTSGISAGEDALAARAREGRMPETYHYRQQEIGTAAEFASRYLKLTGLRYTISTACSSSAKAFASAWRLLATGRCDAAIVGGVDSLCKLTLNGFDALESLAPDRCNPFSANRRGINIGEGACVFVVSKVPAAVRLAGVGESSDAYHISAPDPSGRGAEAAIRAALAQAGALPAAVGYMNLHGTATPKNDEMESQVMARVFGPDGAMQLHEVADRPYSRRGGCTGARVLLVAARRCERSAPSSRARVGRRSRSASAADQPHWRRRSLGARSLRVELVRVRRQ